MLWQCLYGFSYSGMSVLVPVVVNRIFGPKNFGAIFSMITGLLVIKIFS